MILDIQVRRNLILDYKKTVDSSVWKTPNMEQEIIDAILQDSRIVPFEIDQAPYFGQVFTSRPNVRRDWLASAALFCWPGKHLCSGGQVMYTMAGLFSFPILPDTWHIEFRPGYGLADRVTVCRLLPD